MDNRKDIEAGGQEPQLPELAELIGAYSEFDIVCTAMCKYRPDEDRIIMLDDKKDPAETLQDIVDNQLGIRRERRRDKLGRNVTVLVHEPWKEEVTKQRPPKEV